MVHTSTRTLERSTASKKHLRKLFSVQRRALEAITPMQDQQDIFGRLNILPLPQMLTYCVCVFLHEQLSGRGPTVLKLTMQGEGRLLRTTGTRLIKPEYRITGIGRDSFYVRAAKIWNSLPTDIREIESKSLFKRRLKGLLRNNPSERLKYF